MLNLLAPPLLLLAFLLSNLQRGCTLTNVTVDDTSSDIRYSGDWTTSTTTELDYGGTHQLTEDHSATAKLTFTGAWRALLGGRTCSDSRDALHQAMQYTS